MCIRDSDTIDYKDVPRLRKYVSERAKIIPRRVTGTCAYHQRALTKMCIRDRFVTDDGTETDLDLGHYERFIDENLNKYSNLTTGKVYWLSLIHI